jgi:hypothetical protein
MLAPAKGHVRPGKRSCCRLGNKEWHELTLSKAFKVSKDFKEKTNNYAPRHSRKTSKI